MNCDQSEHKDLVCTQTNKPWKKHLSVRWSEQKVIQVITIHGQHGGYIFQSNPLAWLRYSPSPSFYTSSISRCCLCQQLALLCVCLHVSGWIGAHLKFLNRGPSALTTTTGNNIKEMPRIWEIHVDSYCVISLHWQPIVWLIFNKIRFYVLTRDLNKHILEFFLWGSSRTVRWKYVQ